MALVDDLSADVAALLTDEDVGRDVTLRKFAPGTYDAATGATAAGTTTDYAARAIVVNYADRAIDGTLVKQGDRRAIIDASGLGTTPAIGDKLIVGTDTYSVINFKQSELGGTAFVYSLQVRR